MATVVTTPYCGHCGWRVGNRAYAGGDLKRDAVCDAGGCDLTRHGYGKGTATAGTPGSVSPGPAPFNILGCITMTPSPATAWTTGQGIALGNGGTAHWDGSKWVSGNAP